MNHAINFALDDDAEVWRDHPELLLVGGRRDRDWNGWAVPIVTADEFRRFVMAHALNDPNGSWNPDDVIEGNNALIHHWGGPREFDVWVVADDANADGQPVYALDGWTWWVAE